MRSQRAERFCQDQRKYGEDDVAMSYVCKSRDHTLPDGRMDYNLQGKFRRLLLQRFRVLIIHIFGHGVMEHCVNFLQFNY